MPKTISIPFQNFTEDHCSESVFFDSFFQTVRRLAKKNARLARHERLANKNLIKEK
jgi:hypothetical protein